MKRTRAFRPVEAYFRKDASLRIYRRSFLPSSSRCRTTIEKSFWVSGKPGIGWYITRGWTYIIYVSVHEFAHALQGNDSAFWVAHETVVSRFSFIYSFFPCYVVFVIVVLNSLHLTSIKNRLCRPGRFYPWLEKATVFWSWPRTLMHQPRILHGCGKRLHSSLNL